jgi:UDP-2-acetamido-2,6-beta-L-arabino-hexul-4-ose reductase
LNVRVLITGADGFVGRNLKLSLSERADIEIVTFTRTDAVEALPSKLEGVDFVFHLAGTNRPPTPDDFMPGNAGLTEALCAAIRSGKSPIPVLYTSSTQAAVQNPYGASKRAAEEALQAFGGETGSPVHIYRLPNVFGKWARPNYNSAVATFCNNIARSLPITINDRSAALTLVYIDDVIDAFLKVMDGATPMADASDFAIVETVYETTVGDVADIVHGFAESKDSLITARVGQGLVRALYSTYVSYLPPEHFSYAVPMHSDPRGVFVEMLKTEDSGQFSYFTAHPGITRGGHYHHSKTEKFLVIKGKALFKFRHMDSGETHSIETDGSKTEVVETVPGWTHDITNIGDEEMIVMLWANEIFDRERPDTYACAL